MEMTHLALIEEWFKSRCDGTWEPRSGFKLESTDNPGWLATIDADPVHLESISGLRGDEETRVEGQVLDGKVRIFSESLTACMESIVTLIIRERSARVRRHDTGEIRRPGQSKSRGYMTHNQEMMCLEKIDEWYRELCDGLWEHEFGFKLESTDFPGWLVTTDMAHVDLDSVWGWRENIETCHRVDVRMADGKIRIRSESLTSCLESVVTLIIHEQAQRAYRGEPSPFLTTDEIPAGSHVTRTHEKAHLALMEDWFKEHQCELRLEGSGTAGWLVTIDAAPVDRELVLRLREIVEAREIVKVRMADRKISIWSKSLTACLEAVVILIDLHERSGRPRLTVPKTVRL